MEVSSMGMWDVASTSKLALLAPSFRGDAQHRTRNLEIPGFGPTDRPGMTGENFSSATSQSIRPAPNCQQLTSRIHRRRIVEKALAADAVAAPFLIGDLVKAADLAGFVGHLEIPMDGDTIALHHRRHRLGIDPGHARHYLALMGDELVASLPRRCQVLLHGGIFGIIALDGTGMIARLDGRNEFIDSRTRGHETSRLILVGKFKWRARGIRQWRRAACGGAWRLMSA